MMKESSSARGQMEHSDSLESRDNPFLPGGDLSKEAEDLLSRATIIRDNFYLNEEERRTLRENQLIQEHILEAHQQHHEQQIQQQQLQKPPKGGKHVHIVDHLDGNSNPSTPGHEQENNSTPQEVAEERITAQATQAVAASPNCQVGDPKVNGNVGDHPMTLSPETVKITIPDVDGLTKSEGNGGGPDTVANNHDGLQVQGVDEKKRPNKCCTVM